MAKIMLVEDDTNLSEIYQARLTAEGYEIVSAHDGEEALALAAKEKPDLIISDVMMPKISGFEMLDILRNTEGLKETKVIMLTALGQADDKTRAQGLGADRYLVKSQVTLEDIVKAAQELLEGPAAPAAAVPAPATSQTPAPAPAVAPVAPVPTPVTVAAPPIVASVPPVAPTPSVPVAVAPVAPAPTPVAVAAPVPAAPTDPMATPPVAPTMPTPVAPAPAPQPVSAPAPAPAVAPVAPAPTPVAVAAPVPAAPTDPMATPPVAPTDPTAAADNKLVADAVEDLMEGVGGKTTNMTPTPEQTAAATPPTTLDPASPASAPEQTDSTAIDGISKDNVNIAHKKVIKPISDGPEQVRPSLETLLADEERKNPGSTSAPAPSNDQATNAPVTEVPHQPGHIITPSAAESINNGAGIDPNSIAL